MKIDLQLNKKLFSPKLFPLLEDYSHRWEVYKGSAGSGKSYFITQKIIYRCLKEPIRVVVCRRYGSTIRNTCFSLFKEVLNKWKITPYLKIRETDFNIKFPNGSEIIFMGLDEETKLLSLNNISTVFIEEVWEVPQPIVEQLNLRMRGLNKNQQILMAFNPISKSHWLYNFCVENPPESFYFSETTYKDNQFLSQEYVQAIEELEIRNPAKWVVYGLGEWGYDPEGLVFTNWRTTNLDLSLLLDKGYEYRCGCDLGYIDPTAIVKSLWDQANKTVYVFDCYYQRGKQLEEVAQQMEQMELKHTRLFMDSAEPRSIDYFRRKGYNVQPCIKGPGSVDAGIRFLQDMTIIIDSKCQPVIDEFENFCYLLDKKTGKYTDQMDHTYSHSIDALRYAYSDIYTKSKAKLWNFTL